MNAPKLPPLAPGALALRPKIARVRPMNAPIWFESHPAVVGLEVIEVIEQREELVTWTNHKARRANERPAVRFTHTSHRHELIALDWLEKHLAGAAVKSPAVPITAQLPDAEARPAAPASLATLNAP